MISKLIGTRRNVHSTSRSDGIAKSLAWYPRGGRYLSHGGSRLYITPAGAASGGAMTFAVKPPL